ncbi:hypothetical protein HGG64_02050 [Mycoplasma phocoeninasale]|uniref:Gcp-like domain-containing protein n=1 Tax=Mycoplasma phocoeninasale TaxID=2726117 RepID=A0A858U6R7_9MOLU|nr:hypothetical protein [Mycoplasma phocoeninasale]QJG66478.1 hypothetical protein HGG64_02050 [Mycoplasma phocoeninasale]
MELFVETSLTDLYFAIIDRDKVIDEVRIKDLVKKTDLFYETLNSLLSKSNLKINDFSKIYTTTGPGSFSGTRIGFLFAKTISQISKIKLYLCPTYKLFILQKQLLNSTELTVKIKANKYNIYEIKIQPAITCQLIANDGNFDNLDYQLLKDNIAKFLSCFSEVSDSSSIDLEYFHEPQIGGK